MNVVLTQTQRDVIAAWLFDRAESEYGQESACYQAIVCLVRKVREGEPEAFFRHGELDDVLAKWGYPSPAEAT